MTLDALLTLLVIAGAVTLFVSERLPADVVALLVLASVLVLGLVTPAEALSGFSSEATITVAAMFVLSAGLQTTGGVCTLIGTYTHLRVNSLTREPGHRGFGLFAFTRLGLMFWALSMVFIPRYFPF